ncbi:MAG: exodeoxyribonuclease VII large subunit [Bacteroidales bacterium]
MTADNLFDNTYKENKEILSLVEVLDKLSESVRTQFSHPFWLKCEVSKINLYPYSGHAYPELVEKDGQVIVAQTKAIIWKNDFDRINDKFRHIVGENIKDGISIICLARMTFHSLYGLSLIISDIDPNMTLGQLEKERLNCIQRLKNENIFSVNKTKNLPLLPKRLAVISVPSSKGYNDFIQTLDNKSDKYKFFIHLFPSLLQGDNASHQIIEALNVIEKVKEYFDCVLIIRGGGGDIGLHCYNNYELCRKIATFPLPVLTGIGHSTNETVAESISFENFITPTALAEFMLDKMESFDQDIEQIKQKINRLSHIIINEQNKNLSYIKNIIVMNVKNILEKEKNSLNSDVKYIKALDPINILKKGYTITSIEGRIIQSINYISKGDRIETITMDGKFYSTID